MKKVKPPTRLYEKIGAALLSFPTFADEIITFSQPQCQASHSFITEGKTEA
jgi:hypothetical protein